MGGGDCDIKYCKPRAGGWGDGGPRGEGTVGRGVRGFRSMLVSDTTQNMNNKSIKKPKLWTQSVLIHVVMA